MNFTKSIDILYNKFFDNKNFKDIDLPFIDDYKEFKFLKVTNPEAYEKQKKSKIKKNSLYRDKHYKPNLKAKARTINRRIKTAQKLITNSINEIKRFVGEK